MITSNEYVGLKMANSDDELVSLGLVALDLTSGCHQGDVECIHPQSPGEIRFKVTEDAHSEGYCVVLNAEKDKLARRFEVAVVGDSIVHLGGIVTAVRIEAVPNTTHLSMTATVQLKAGPTHEFTCA